MLGKGKQRVQQAARALGLDEWLDTVAALRIVDTSKLHDRPSEEHLARLLPYLEVDCVFDVGANAGQYARRLRKGAGYKGHIVSFEPTPELAARLRLDSANDSKWTIREMALGPQTGSSAFNVMSNSQFSSLREPDHSEVALFKRENTIERTIEVPTDTLSEQFKLLKEQIGFRSPFLKLDTQGFDLDVIESGRDVLDEFVGLQSELSIKRLYEGSADFAHAAKRYRELGFEFSAIVPNNRGNFPLLVEVDAIMIRRDIAERAAASA